MNPSFLDILSSVAKKNPGLTAAYVGIVAAHALEFLLVPYVVSWSVPGLIQRKGINRKYLAILFIVLCFVFTIYISDTYITTIYANIINTEVEHRVVSCILTSETISSVETDRGSWTYSTIEYGSELNEFVKSLRNNWISPLIFLFASTVTLWYTSDWGTNIVHALQLCVAVGAPLIVVFGNI